MHHPSSPGKYTSHRQTRGTTTMERACFNIQLTLVVKLSPSIASLPCVLLLPLQARHAIPALSRQFYPASRMGPTVSRSTCLVHFAWRSTSANALLLPPDFWIRLGNKGGCRWRERMRPPSRYIAAVYRGRHTFFDKDRGSASSDPSTLPALFCFPSGPMEYPTCSWPGQEIIRGVE